MSNEEKAIRDAGTALFNVQNELTGFYHMADDAGQDRIEAAQRKICEAIEALGGADKLLEMGA